MTNLEALKKLRRLQPNKPVKAYENLTNQQLLAYVLRKSGKSYQDVAEVMGTTKQATHELVKKAEKSLRGGDKT
jgi:transcriptional regulator